MRALNKTTPASLHPTAILFCGIQAGIYAAQIPPQDDAVKAVKSIMNVYKSFDEVARTEPPRKKM